jgi:hypothetical protein
MSFLYVSDIFDRLKRKKVVHKVIINDWITQHCEDAADLEGYKKFHLHTHWLASF